MKPENFKFYTIKNFRKALAETIRIKKQLRKLEKNQHLEGFAPDAVERAKQEPASLWSLRFQARHYNIAYAEFKGKTRQQIEPKTAEHTQKPEESLIKSIKDAMIAENPRPVEAAKPVLPEVAPNA